MIKSKITLVIIIFSFLFVFNCNTKDVEEVGFSNENLKLFLAVKNGNINKIEKYIKNGGDVNVFGTPRRNTPAYFSLLMAALYYKRTNIVKLLVKNGADVNAQTGMPRHTVMNYAIRSGSREMLNFLISKGADVNGSKTSDLTPLMHAISDRNIELVDFLLSKGADINKHDAFFGFNPMFKAINIGYKKGVVHLIKKGAMVTDVYDNRRKYSLLMKAVKLGYLEIIKILVKNGVEVNYQTDLFPENALSIAKRMKYEKIVSYLLSVGAKTPW